MGTFSVPIQVSGPEANRWESLDALVDTGASHTVLPRPVLERLGVRPLRRVPFRLADKRQVDYEVGQARVRLDGQEMFTVVVFGDAHMEPLLGAVTLEEFHLGVDPVGRRLIPVPGLLM